MPVSSDSQDYLKSIYILTCDTIISDYRVEVDESNSKVSFIIDYD